MCNSGRSTYCRRGLAGSHQVAFVLLASGNEMFKCHWVTRIKKRLKKAQIPQSSFCHPSLQQHSHTAVSLRLHSAPHCWSAAAHGSKLAAWMLNCFMPCYLARNSFTFSLYSYFFPVSIDIHLSCTSTATPFALFSKLQLFLKTWNVTCFNPKPISTLLKYLHYNTSQYCEFQ